MMTLRHIVVLGLVAFLATYALVPLVRKLAIKVDAVDYPDARRVNTEPIPRMGGLAMIGGLLVAIVVELLGEHFLHWYGFFTTHTLGVNYLIVLAGALVVAAVGVVDDIKSIKPLAKLLGQILGAVIITLGGVLISHVSNPFGPGLIHFGWLAYPLTVIYLVVFMNAINLIDGLDGLAAGIVCIAAIALFSTALFMWRVETAFLSMLLIGMTAAFLRYNFHPASIFMGDSGSLFLGMMIGVVSILGIMRASTVVVLISPFIVAAIPFIDSLAAIIRRIKRHQPIQQADKDHLHHRLLRSGLNQRQAVGIVWGWTFLLGICAFLITMFPGWLTWLIVIVLIVASFVIFYKTGIFEMVLRHYYNPRAQDGSESDESDK